MILMIIVFNISQIWIWPNHRSDYIYLRQFDKNFRPPCDILYKDFLREGLRMFFYLWSHCAEILVKWVSCSPAPGRLKPSSPRRMSLTELTRPIWWSKSDSRPTPPSQFNYIFQTRRSHPWLGQPEAGRPLAGRGGRQRVGGRQHRRVLQPDHDVDRNPGRPLHWGDVPGDVCRTQVWISLGWRETCPETNQVLGAQVYWLPDDLDTRSDWWRGSLPQQDRSSLPPQLYLNCQVNPEKTLQNLRPRLSPTF